MLNRQIGKPVVLATVLAFIFVTAIGTYWLARGGVIIPWNSRFACEIQPEPTGDNYIYVVTYRNDNDKKPWLKIVRSFGDGWTQSKRCESIVERLEKLRKDGLIQLTYRTDPATPRQYIICANTKKSGRGCELLITLMPDDDPDKTLREIADALLLRNINSGVYQGSDPDSPSPKSSLSKALVIDLTDKLAIEDRIAGN
ncbi:MULTISPECIES: COP23 domain-containing protein [unclassified Microcoleus]|uniref:COP23 domain-containing protein n=1 Tax=unclassified Microcoleus TaxID=2642155 RepID=UPI001DBA43D2|nr:MULTISPECIES: COP23 domain-containing protein [unclassified Microcoleus]MCC3438821.1 COP23 domain-containing protein [Microcoleus sp. PH2017_05_CCC_O_A]MCC3585153.1 COP23 domain-containing protein [Microcoleus sp. PH2017_30_WIL_O_A]TAG47388.1 MAG: hypothetical protein EAZ33_04740 [Oscillatoriales cyanobacterium]TAG59996.1 MAG: hypothetical protein EAZ28_09330 [Oscillatoriales cyanobacterium]